MSRMQAEGKKEKGISGRWSNASRRAKTAAVDGSGGLREVLIVKITGPVEIRISLSSKG